MIKSTFAVPRTLAAAQVAVRSSYAVNKTHRPPITSGRTMVTTTSAKMAHLFVATDPSKYWLFDTGDIVVTTDIIFGRLEEYGSTIDFLWLVIFQ